MNKPKSSKYLIIIAKFILIGLTILSFYYGISILIELGLKEKFEIKGPSTESDLIHISTEDRLTELNTVSTIVIAWLSTVVLLLIAGLYFLRRK